ncbi:acyl carrier protein [Paenibacillus chitinolyticus]|uniref:acyl carrier protein n=1 Tax=Paenibacillus chitinolyticus TaxID=79263 RepID=UPI0038637C1B
MEIVELQIKLIEWVGQLTEQELDERALSEPLQELGVDSLMALELAVHVERGFGVRLSEEELASIRTLEDIVKAARAKEPGL